MKLGTVETRDFGRIELNEKNVYNFTQPLYGFEGYSEFLLISEDNTEGYLAWLQSLDEPALCFILLNPEAFKLDYTFELANEYISKLGDGNYEVWLVAVIKDNLDTATVNLRSPIIINAEAKTAVQILLDSEYSVRYPVYPQ